MIPMFQELSRQRTTGPNIDMSVWDRIDASGDCWLWTGYLDRGGYGRTQVFGKNQGVHRAVWEALVGEIPDGLQIDHLCRNASCCNPDHLEVVTGQENMSRGYIRSYPPYSAKTHCKQGHPLSGDNLRLSKQKYGGLHRQCKACGNASHRKRSRELRAEKLLGGL